MTREALLAPLLLGCTAAAVPWPALQPLAALLALAFLYRQARILQAARGIPAWREPLTVPLIVATGLAEGAGLYWLAAAAWQPGRGTAWLALGALLVLRLASSCSGIAAWQPSCGRRTARRAPHGDALQRRHAAALALVLLVAVAPVALSAARWQALAGALSATGGALFKFMLVTRAGFNQGFALPHLPVRGSRR